MNDTTNTHKSGYNYVCYDTERFTKEITLRPGVYAIVGKNGSGKTQFLQNFIYKGSMESIIPYEQVFIVSDIEDITKEYKCISDYVYEEKDLSSIFNNINDSEKKKLIIIDNCNLKTTSDRLYNAYHYNLTIIISVKSLSELSSSVRSNLEGLFVAKVGSIEEHKKIMEFVGYNSFDVFSKMNAYEFCFDDLTMRNSFERKENLVNICKASTLKTDNIIKHNDKDMYDKIKSQNKNKKNNSDIVNDITQVIDLLAGIRNKLKQLS